MRLTLVPVVVLFACGCHSGNKSYQSRVEMTRFDVVHRDDAGTPLTGDIELEWTDCPGEQREITRGNQAFVECMAKYKPGDQLPVQVDWGWDAPSEQYDWDITKVGDCTRPPEAHDEASFDMVQECETLKEQGVPVGFHCSRVPKHELLEKCPWFRRR